MSASADRKQIESLAARLQKARRGSKQHRHLRRALERAIERAAKSYEKGASREP